MSDSGGTRRELNASRHKLHQTQAELDYHLELFGDSLARKHKYKNHDGLDAVRFYLMTKYHWTPAVVKAMSMDDLHFALAEEMHGWTVPRDRSP